MLKKILVRGDFFGLIGFIVYVSENLSFQELKKSLISILSFFGRVSNGMILRMMLVSHIDFLRILNPIKIKMATATDKIEIKTMKAVIKLFSNI